MAIVLVGGQLCFAVSLALPSSSDRCLVEEIAATVTPGTHAVLPLDQTGWHTIRKLPVPDNITLLPPPARSPELNPVENLWQFMRENWLGNRIFQSYADILDQCCNAWNKLIAPPSRIMSIGLRQWAYEF